MKEPLKKNFDYGMDFQERIRRRMRLRQASLISFGGQLIDIDTKEVDDMSELITKEVYDTIKPGPALKYDFKEVLKALDAKRGVTLKIDKPKSQGFIPFIRRFFGHEEKFSMKDVKNRDVDFSIKVWLQPGIPSQDEFYTYSANVMKTIRNPDRKILDCDLNIKIPMYKSFFRHTSREVFLKKIKKALVHEMTHIRQLTQLENGPGYSRVDSKTHPEEHNTLYFNNIFEYQSIAREVVEFLRDKIKDQEPELIPLNGRDILLMMEDSWVFNQAMKYLNPQNKKSFLSYIYNGLKKDGVI